MPERTGPCREKNCSDCCDPVKVSRFFPADKIPKDAEGRPLWEKREETLVPEHDQGTKLEAYDCRNLNSETGECIDYANRPEICKKSGCVDPESGEAIEEQHRRIIEQKFTKIK